MPLELKYLAVVESALNPTAGSHAGAKGLWQFMYSTGKVYGLNVTSLVDDRFDPLKATDAACRHLSDLYNIFDDWFLALAAYNSGTGNVNKAIRRAGGIKNYWAIWPYLPRETRGYVPAFIAVNYIMNYYLEHNISPLDPGIIKTGIDTVTVHQPLAFDQLNEMLSIPMGDIKFFNPQYKAGIIPATDKNPCILVLPEKYVGDYIDNEKQLYEFKTKKGIDKEKLQEEMKKISDRSVHVVKSGENLGSIARRYRVSVKQLQSWNNLKGTTIYPGQKLIVYSSGAPMAQAGNSSPVSRSTTQKIHTVKSGENLSVIAHKYKCTVTNLKDWNNLRSNTIKVGQKLKVYPPADENSYSSTTRNGDYVIHTVKSGENLSVIAQKYKCSISELKDWNDLRSNTIKVGQKLKVYSVSRIDFVNGFIEDYGDPMGMKATWEAVVNFKDLDATKRSSVISQNAQWFEDNSPVDERFKKKECKGVQITVFLVVSAIALYFTRPLVKKFVNNKVEPTNADIVIGKECRVTETIDNIAGTGAVYVDGKTWTARSADDSETIPEGTLVTARQIDGVKLIVSAMEKETIK